MTKGRSYIDSPSVEFLNKLLDINYSNDIFMSLANMPKDMEGTCYKITLKSGDAKKSLYYLNSTPDIERNRSLSRLELSAAPQLPELLNFLVFYKLDKE